MNKIDCQASLMQTSLKSESQILAFTNTQFRPHIQNYIECVFKLPYSKCQSNPKQTCKKQDLALPCTQHPNRAARVCVFILQNPKAKAMQIQRPNVIKHILTIIVGVLVLLPETEIRISPRYESNIQTIQCSKCIMQS